MYDPDAVQYDYDPSNNVVYMQIRPGRTVHKLRVRSDIRIDVDEYGWVLGLEVTDPEPELLHRLGRLIHEPPIRRPTK